MRIVTILGARPQFIKASVVSEAIRQSNHLNEVMVHTGQHFDSNMSDIFFAELDMRPPEYTLDIHGGGHGQMTGRMLVEIERVLLTEQPDAVLVYGDTNSTLAGALAAVKLHIPVAHVEAGLRSFNMAMPEEVNRILTDRISRWLFTPTSVASQHLLDEGVGAESIDEVGDVMYDVALCHGDRVGAKGRVLGALDVSPKSYILVTVHRAENTDCVQRMTAIVDGLLAVAQQKHVIWPVHPRTRAALNQFGLFERAASQITITEPLGYLDMAQMEKYAALIATDSGGVQKEAFFYRVPCVTLRDETEWTELVQGGWNHLTPPHSSKDVHHAIDAVLGSSGQDITPYGKGQAAKQIVDRLAHDLCG